MAGYGFSETGILKIPSHYGRLQENLSSLQFHSAEYNYAFKISGPIPAHRYYLCPDFHKWLLALFSSYGFKLKGVNESNTTNTNATNSPELSTSQTHAFVPLRDCIGPHVQNFDWYFVRKWGAYEFHLTKVYREHKQIKVQDFKVQTKFTVVSYRISQYVSKVCEV